MKRLMLVNSAVSIGLISSGCAGTKIGFESIPGFEEIPANSGHVWDDSVHPFTGAAVIDVDNDGEMEVVISGRKNQTDALLSYRDGKLVDTIEGSGLSSQIASYGPISIDIDNDNDVDLIVARNDGLYLYLNDDGKFSQQRIPLELPFNSVPFSIALSDIDYDGNADLYVSVFVNFANFKSASYNDPEHAKLNIILGNNGDLIFTDITQASGTTDKSNTFLSVFTDLNNDGWQDLVVSQNTGEIDMFRNNQDSTFTSIPPNSGFGFWMGLGVGDIDKEGDQDLFFSNVGDSIPAFLTTGDIRDDQRHELEWLLLRNDGDFNFTDITKEYGITGEGFSWGGSFEDLDLDGKLDLVVAQNYLKLLIHRLFKLKGRSYLQTDDNKFVNVKNLGLENPYFGQSPLSVDFNGDARPDLLWLNMDGPVRAFLNKSLNNVFTVKAAETAKLLGTRRTIETSLGISHTREVMTSTGMLTDHSPNLFFGLGNNEQTGNVVNIGPDGKVENRVNPARGQQLVCSCARKCHAQPLAA
jgi:hypothetical protein